MGNKQGKESRDSSKQSLDAKSQHTKQEERGSANSARSKQSKDTTPQGSSSVLSSLAGAPGHSGKHDIDDPTKVLRNRMSIDAEGHVERSRESASQVPIRPGTASGRASMDQLRSSTRALNEKTLSEATSRLIRVQSREDFKQEFHAREVANAALKRKMAADWLPEYRPASIIPPEQSADTILTRVTRISQATLLKDVPVGRKVKIICTMGPASWSEEGLEKLISAGLNVARFNFSHGTHAGHQEVLDRLRKVAASKQRTVAYLLDTKGPEIRTAMLKDGKDIELEAGDIVTVVGVGEDYDTWQGYKDPVSGETKIGLSYAKLATSVKPGNIILIADGAISIEVVEILNDKELKGKVINSHKLGQRKNCNLPGVHVDLPVLAPNDVNDLQNFACKNKMDFIAASFVQCADDVRFIRKVLDEAGGKEIKIISKIENQAGLRNIDEIIKLTDGIMVARGDLAMEVPAEKIALAQKMIIAKCLLAGKFAVTATQMLESMIEHPIPTRAEMTDVANAVFDGTDAVMLSGESANGQWPDTAVATMASIVETAELAIDYGNQLDWIRVHSESHKAGPVSPLEAAFASIAKAAVSFCFDKNGDGVLDASEGCIAIVFTDNGFGSDLVAKYRPPCPVVVISRTEHVLKRSCVRFGLYPCPLAKEITELKPAIQAGIEFATNEGLYMPGRQVIVIHGPQGTLWADEKPGLTAVGRSGLLKSPTLAHEGSMSLEYQSPYAAQSITCAQTLRIGPDLIINRQFNHRSTKIIATLGPSCWSPPMLATLIAQGVSIARINMSLCSDTEQISNIIEHWKQVVNEKAHAQPLPKMYTSLPALMCSIKGPEIRSTMLKGHNAIQLTAGKEITLVATNDARYEGSGTDTKTVIGITYTELCKTAKAGDVILVADGKIKLQVSKVNNNKELTAKVLNTGKLGEAKLVHILNARLNIPFLSQRDKDLLTFCARHSADVDFVTLPFVQDEDDLVEARKILDNAGGARIKMIAQIDNPSAIQNYDSILASDDCDGIMISRGHLGMRMPARKVALAQKWLITKANIAGKPIIVGGQMLESMVDIPRPTRAEMTDVANAAYDGADAILLRSETAHGNFVEKVVANAAAILRDAEVGIDHYNGYNTLRNFTPKPMATLEAVCSSAIKAAIDMDAVIVCLVTNTVAPIRTLTKYRPHQAVLVCTTQQHIANQCNLFYGTVPLLLTSTRFNLGQIRDKVVDFARRQGLAAFSSGDNKGDQLIMVSGPQESIFCTDEELNELAFMTMIVGDESSELVAPKGYDGEDTIAYRSTKVGLDLVCDPIDTPRKTKIICTLGPKCWSEDGLSKLMTAGMNVARFNFSHGAHADHQQVLDRVKVVAAQRDAKIALLLDTKGPEVRTAMLKDGKDIELEAGQSIIVEAVGDAYDKWEGYKNETETRIGLSYAHLCQDVKVGGRILIGDGTITLEVLEILTEKELKAKVLNSHKLGQRKNCNLPGVKVRLPVLMQKDIDDVQNFACKNHMDFIAASFVQSAEDVRFIRRTLDAAGGRLIKIISKIESAVGLRNFDEILRETDGIMVARGDLAMEIPSEKVALAQKMMITKANIAGKFIITATQMLESMIENPLPTRAEMTDVANAVFDGTDAVMLSGETANGAFPDKAVATMAAIVANAEVGINYYQNYDFIRDFTHKPMSTKEAVLGCAAKDAMDVDAGMIVVVTTKGDAARLISKYRPKVPVLVITSNERVMRQCSPVFALYPYLVDSLPYTRDDVEFDILLEKAVIFGIEKGMCMPGKDVVVVHGAVEADAEGMPMVSIKAAPGVPLPYVSDRVVTKTLSMRTTAISLADVLDYYAPPRKTKIVCTLGPASWTDTGLDKLLDAGLNVARFNFSHGTHESHQEVLDRLHKVASAKKRRIAYLLDTKGPEVRTAMVKDGKNIELVAGQEVTLVAVGSDYDKWEGYKDEATGETKIGISYDKLCQSVSIGGRILVSDGTLSIEVVEILNDKELKGRCLNSKSLGPRKNVNLPGVHVDIPVLTEKDIEDLQNFCCKNKMDFVAASFVQSEQDVLFIRRILDEAGGENVKIISKIENEAGLTHFDQILVHSDGIMVARGDLAMEIPSEKVALAQKMMITKANVAGKFVITATQMLESMCNNPLPTRAEMTDVANAVFDGTDAVMLSGETANGKFPDTAVKTMAAIVANAENANGYNAMQCFIRDHSSKPFTRGEAFGAVVASTMVDCNAQLVIVLSQDGFAARLVSKYRPAVPTLVVTTQEHVANQACAIFGQYAVKVSSMDAGVDILVLAAKAFALKEKLWNGKGVGVVLHGAEEASADVQPVMRVVDLEHLDATEALARPVDLKHLAVPNLSKLSLRI